MRLKEKEYQQFLNVNQSLVLYAGKKKKIIAASVSLSEYQQTMDGKTGLACANAFYDNPRILKDFIKENPDGLNEDDLVVAQGFEHFVRGQFFVCKYLKDYAIFIQDKYAFGVLALSDPFQAFFGNRIPTVIETVLLPYKDKIVYHGFIVGGNMHFGRNYKQSLNEAYKTAKAKYGIITSLPFDGFAVYERQSPSDQLTYFMKTKGNREEFEVNIQQLIKKHPQLLPQYYQAWGKIDAAYYKKKYKELGLNKAYYAILQGNIISGAVTQKDLLKAVNQIVPPHKKDWVYTFKM